MYVKNVPQIIILLNNFSRKNIQPQENDSSDDDMQCDTISNEELFKQIVDNIYSLVAQRIIQKIYNFKFDFSNPFKMDLDQQIDRDF